MKPTTLLPILLTTIPATQAWGTLGHQTVALLAQSYLLPETTTWAQTILNNTNTTYLADISTWADTYRYTTPGKFSAGYHYIDAEDTPPSMCSVNLTRDCSSAEGCIVSAIANYTSRVSNTSLDSEQRDNALRFVVHFFGDVTQPLHDEAIAIGGNGINVTFDGKHTNLHHIWDTEIPEKSAGVKNGTNVTMADSVRWAGLIKDEIESGCYREWKKGWVEGVLNVTDPTASALSMARDGNMLVCSFTLKGGVEMVEMGDLGGSYYEGVAPVVRMQIAKGGYRLAAWLNLLATGKTGIE